ncbi:MAG: glycosyltransferase [Planctomycetes bacterium]|nr:glycosyltransferase [Planctomycetota bacterium]MCB9891122.1 glycosyltransferase [Planctomycetota bacterium]MCB9918890.1 glycosyltransferase [Planctomycetota bacterium]
MNIVLASPARAGSRSGNGRSAARYRGLWTELGHRVRVTTTGNLAGADILVALHATKCAASIDAWRTRDAHAPLIVIVAGTDLAGRARERFERSLDAADAIVTLQPHAIDSFPKRARSKARAILQSASATLEHAGLRHLENDRDFEIAVVAALREVKDPLRAALAVRALPKDSKIRVTHYGPALDESIRREAERLSDECERYTWQGARSHRETMALLARSRALCLTSISEGGANVVSEALAHHLPVLCSAIPGNLGILGDDWPATFEVRDTASLLELLLRFESDERFRNDVERRTRVLAAYVTPARELAAWNGLFREVCAPGHS